MVGDGKTVLIPVRTVKNVDKRIGGAEQEAAAFSKHPVSLVKNRLRFGDIGHRYRAEYQVESTVSKRRTDPAYLPGQSSRADVPAGRLQPILAQLGQRVVEYGNIRSGCRQNWRLLPAAAGARIFTPAKFLGNQSRGTGFFGGKQNGKKARHAPLQFLHVLLAPSIGWRFSPDCPTLGHCGRSRRQWS